MSTMNQVFLMGNLTRDPECRKTPAGMAVSDLGLAISDNYKDKDGKLIERTCFADIVVWGKQAESCRQFLKKGAPVLVEGKLQWEQWQTENGEKRNKLRVVANRVQFLGRPADAGSSKSATDTETMEVGSPF